MSAENALRQQIRALEKQVAEVTQERDDLTRDLENLCLSANGNATFRSSSVLSERIYATEKELSRYKQQLSTVIGERDSLRDELRAAKEARRQGEHALLQQQERAQQLDRELAFYQQQAAKVMADRDKAAWEAEEMRAANLGLDAKLREASSRAETEGAQRRQLESQVAFLKGRVVELEAKAAQAAVVPSLRQELAKADEETRRVQERERQLQEEAKQLQRQLGEAEGGRAAAEREAAAKEKQMGEAAASAAGVEARLLEEVSRLQAEGEDLRKQLKAAQSLAEERGAAADTAKEENWAAARKRADAELQQKKDHAAELARLKADHEKQLAELREAVAGAETAAAAARVALEEVTQQKVAALMRQSTAEMAKSKADESIERLMADIVRLREQLAQANKEKAAAQHAADAARGLKRSDTAEDGVPGAKASPAEKRGWFGGGSPLKG